MLINYFGFKQLIANQLLVIRKDEIFDLIEKIFINLKKLFELRKEIF